MTQKLIGIVDYGVGNIRSVEMALRAIGASSALISKESDSTQLLDGLILPGVGSFPNGMRRLKASGLDVAVRNFASDGVPVLGICLGMQLLFEGSTELGGAEGLGLLSGTIQRLDELEVDSEQIVNERLPNIGWRETYLIESPGTLVPGDKFYFVHSYAASAGNSSTRLVSTFGNLQFAASARREEINGVQFHPEKSGAAGLRLIAEVLGLSKKALIQEP